MYLTSTCGTELVRYNTHAVQQRDHLKQVICATNGITLLVIPYWWNKSIEVVLHGIAALRPDLDLKAGS